MTAEAQTLITDGKRLTIADFRICMFESDLSPLGGDPEQRQAAWESIYSQFIEWFGGAGAVASIAQMRDINALASKIERIQAMVFIAAQLADLGIVSEEITDELAADGYAIDASATPADYILQLKNIDARLAPEKMRLNKLRRDLPNQRTPEELAESMKSAEDGFEGLLVEVIRYLKMELNEQTTTLYRLYQIVKRMMKEKPATTNG